MAPIWFGREAPYDVQVRLEAELAELESRAPDAAPLIANLAYDCCVPAKRQELFWDHFRRWMRRHSSGRGGRVSKDSNFPQFLDFLSDLKQAMRSAPTPQCVDPDANFDNLAWHPPTGKCDLPHKLEVIHVLNLSAVQHLLEPPPCGIDNFNMMVRTLISSVDASTRIREKMKDWLARLTRSWEKDPFQPAWVLLAEGCPREPRERWLRSGLLPPAQQDAWVAAFQYPLERLTSSGASGGLAAPCTLDAFSNVFFPRHPARAAAHGGCPIDLRESTPENCFLAEFVHGRCALTVEDWERAGSVLAPIEAGSAGTVPLELARRRHADRLADVHGKISHGSVESPYSRLLLNPNGCRAS